MLFWLIKFRDRRNFLAFFDLELFKLIILLELAENKY